MNRLLLVAAMLLPLVVSGQTNVTPDGWLKLQPKPNFKPGHRLALLTKFSWPHPIDLRLEMADHWGYALALDSYEILITNGLSLHLANTNSTTYKVVQLATNNPSKYRIQFDIERIWPTNLSRGFWVTNSAGLFVDQNTNTWADVTNTSYIKVVSPAADDSDLVIQALAITKPLTQLVAMGVSIGIVMNGGERDLNVEGFDRTAWQFDPRIQATAVFTNAYSNPGNTNGLSWPRYTSQQKGRHLLRLSEKIRDAAPNRQYYIFYNNGNEQARFNQPGYRWEDEWARWGWHTDEVEDAMDILSYESYFVGGAGQSYTNIPNAAWNQVSDLLSRHLSAVGANLRRGQSTNYAFVCAGWSLSNSNRFSEMPRYVGFLKALYTSGTIGATAGYFDLPTNTVPSIFGNNGFAGSFPTNNPPHWLMQIEALSRVHGYFTYLDGFTFEGSLLPGPTNHFVCRDISAYEFPNSEGDIHVRTLARKKDSTNEWLITSWCAAGDARNVTITVPTLGSVVVNARPEGSIYRATTNSLVRLDDAPATPSNFRSVAP